MADLVIRGVTLPKGDLEYMQLWIYGDGRVYVTPYEKMRSNAAGSSQRLPERAVPLPEGHGRLGDLDALEKELAFDYAYAAAKVCHNADTLVPAEGGGLENE